MGGGQPSDRRAGYTHADFEKSWNWAQAKHDYHIILKDNGDYASSPWDILQYVGCVSFASTPERSPLLKAPFYTVEFDAMDRDLRYAVAQQIQAVAGRLGFMEGPVTAFIYRDYNSLGDGRSWFDNHGNDYDRFRREFSQTLPVTVILMFPSITKDGKRAPNYARLGTQHKWLTDMLELPQTSYYNKWMMQCYTYCEDSSGKFFPCGCSWDNECQAKVRGKEGVIDTVQKHTLFYGAYMINVSHGWIYSLFQYAQYLSLRQNILPMDMTMYNNCRFVMKSLNAETYVYEIGKTQSHVLRKGVVGTRRVCERGGWPSYATHCYDRYIPTRSYTDVCKQYESEKYSFNGCNDDSSMCAGKTAEQQAAFESERAEQQYNVYYSMPYRKASNKVRMALTIDSLAAYSEDQSQQGDLLWVWSFQKIPKSVRIPPLALVLTDKGELVLFNGLNQQIGSLSEEMGINVREEDENYGEDDGMTDEERRRMEELLDYLRNRADQAMRDARKKGSASGVGDGRGGDGGPGCDPPPFTFV